MSKNSKENTNINKNKIVNESKTNNTDDKWKLSMQELLKGGCMINWDSPSVWEKRMPDAEVKKKSA